MGRNLRHIVVELWKFNRTWLIYILWVMCRSYCYSEFRMTVEFVILLDIFVIKRENQEEDM